MAQYHTECAFACRMQTCCVQCVFARKAYGRREVSCQWGEGAHSSFRASNPPIPPQRPRFTRFSPTAESNGVSMPNRLRGTSERFLARAQPGFREGSVDAQGNSEEGSARTGCQTCLDLVWISPLDSRKFRFQKIAK